MPSNFGFVAAAYLLVLGSMLAYGLWVRARRARLAEELRRTESNSDAKGASGRAVSH